MPRRLAAVLTLVLATACSNSAPRLQYPQSGDAYCGGGRSLKLTAIQSIVTTTDDRPDAGPVPSHGALVTMLRSMTGAVARWNNDQPLYLPKTAKQLGYPGAYVTLVEAAIPNVPGGSTSRPLYMTFKLPSGGTTTLGFHAYDVQNVCVEGRRQG